jgi:hypothetical protein
LDFTDLVVGRKSMTNVGPAPASFGATTPAASGTRFVDWGAVFAGAVLAAAISFVLLTFGAAIGLSATSPWPNAGASTKVIASIAVFWAIAQQIGSYMAGGYVAGRMRSRWHEIGHEAEFRDGLHGGIVWAVGVVLSAALFLSAAGSAATTGAHAVGRTAASAVTTTNDPMDAVMDTMVRPATVAQVASASGAAASSSQSAATGVRLRGDESRAEMSRIIAGAVAMGSLSGADRTYLAQIVAQRAGIPQQEAERRVDDAVTSARQAADKARRAGILTGFVTAASLVLSLGAVWWAAMRGGHHRDHSIPARFEFGDHRRRVTPTTRRRSTMFRDIILWMAGVPIFVIVLLHLFGVFH